MSLADAINFGTEYALLRGAQDDQTEEIAAMLRSLQQQQQPAPAPAPAAPSQVDVDVHIHQDDDADPNAKPVNALDWSKIELPETWEDYKGQEALKRELLVAIRSAKARGVPLGHVLLAAPAGAGKTTLALMIAKELNARVVQLVPPFNIYTLVKAAEDLLDGDVLFIDEIHLLALKRHGEEILLTIMPDFVAYMPDGEVVELNRITIIGATTEKAALRETVLDRFKIKPRWEAYTKGDLAEIAEEFSGRLHADAYTTPELSVAIAYACGGVPRIGEELVMAALDLGISLDRPPTPAELFEYKRVEPDGLFKEHVDYLTHLRRQCRREMRWPDGSKWFEYVAGEAHMMTLLQETKPAIGRIERTLITLGFLEKCPRGRRLTPDGLARAERLIREGKGV